MFFADISAFSPNLVFPPSIALMLCLILWYSVQLSVFGMLHFFWLSVWIEMNMSPGNNLGCLLFVSLYTREAAHARLLGRLPEQRLGNYFVLFSDWFLGLSGSAQFPQAILLAILHNLPDSSELTRSVLSLGPCRVEGLTWQFECFQSCTTNFCSCLCLCSGLYVDAVIISWPSHCSSETWRLRWCSFRGFRELGSASSTVFSPLQVVALHLLGHVCPAN